MRFFHSVFQLLLALYVAMHFYLAAWLRRRFDLYPDQHRKFRNALLLLAVSFPAARMMERSFPCGATAALLWLSAAWAGSAFIWATAALITDTLTWALGRTPWPEPTDRDAGKACLWLTGGLILFAFWQGNAAPRIRSMDIPVKGLASSLDGFTVVQVSDLHLSSTAGARRLERIAESINGLSADLVVLSGDIVDRGFDEPEKACAAFKSIRSKHGVAAVLGNHDRFSGAAVGLYQRCGVRLLRNESYEPVPGLQLAGVDDMRHGRVSARDIARLTRSLSPNKPSILLSHEPLRPGMVPASGSGLILSGHTHGGQIFPFGLIIRSSYAYFQGLYRRGDFHIYVTTGAGTWGPPMRLFTSSELPVFKLRSR